MTDVNSTQTYRDSLHVAMASVGVAGRTSASVELLDDREQAWHVRRGPESGRWVVERAAEPQDPGAAKVLMFDAAADQWPVPANSSLARTAAAMRAHDIAHPRRDPDAAIAEDGKYPGGPHFIG